MSYRRIIFFLIDGARPDVFEELLRRGELPALSRAIIEPGFYRRILTSFPSTTGPAYLPYLTGCQPGRCNIPGIRWLDRSNFGRAPWSLRECRSYVGPGSFFLNGDIDKRVETLFEKAKKPVSLFSLVNRGVGFSGNHTKVRAALYALYGRLTDDWGRIDRAIGAQLCSALEGDPDLIFAVFPAVDEYSHHHSPFDKRVREAFKGVDKIIEKATQQLKARGRLEETLMVLASDHGLTETAHHLDLDRIAESCSGQTPFSYPKIYRRWSNVAVMPSGNAFAHLYAKTNGSWQKRNLDEELAKGWPHSLLEALCSERATAWIATLAERDHLVIRGNNGESRAWRVGDLWHYASSGTDPLHLENIRFPLSREALLDATFDAVYPDPLESLLQLFSSRRSGDILVTAQPGFDLRSRFEFPEHRASHGSLHREHMQVPFACSAPLSGNEWRLRRSVDVYPTLCRLMGWSAAAGIDGESPI